MHKIMMSVSVALCIGCVSGPMEERGARRSPKGAEAIHHSYAELPTGDLKLYSVPPFAQVTGVDLTGGKVSIHLKGAIPTLLRDFMVVEVYYPAPGRMTQFSKAVIIPLGSGHYPSKPPLVNTAGLIDTESLKQLQRVSIQNLGTTLAFDDRSIRAQYGTPALLVVRFVPESVPFNRIDLNNADVQVFTVNRALQKVQIGLPG